MGNDLLSSQNSPKNPSGQRHSPDPSSWFLHIPPLKHSISKQPFPMEYQTVIDYTDLYVYVLLRQIID